jgi:hypothetical protein
MGLRFEIKVIRASENQGPGYQGIRKPGKKPKKIFDLISRYPDGHHLMT